MSYIDEEGTLVLTEEEHLAIQARLRQDPTYGTVVGPILSEKARAIIERISSGDRRGEMEPGAGFPGGPPIGGEPVRLGEPPVALAGIGAGGINWAALLAPLLAGLTTGGLAGAVKVVAPVALGVGAGLLAGRVTRGAPGLDGIPGLPLVGPGVPEPPASMVKRRWETRVYDNELGYIKLNFYALTDGRVAMYHNSRGYWKVWRPKRNLVIGAKMNLNNVLRAERRLSRILSKLQRRVKRRKLISEAK